MYSFSVLHCGCKLIYNYNYYNYIYTYNYYNYKYNYNYDYFISVKTYRPTTRKDPNTMIITLDYNNDYRGQLPYIAQLAVS